MIGILRFPIGVFFQKPLESGCRDCRGRPPARFFSPGCVRQVLQKGIKGVGEGSGLLAKGCVGLLDVEGAQTYP